MFCKSYVYILRVSHKEATCLECADISGRKKASTFGRTRALHIKAMLYFIMQLSPGLESFAGSMLLHIFSPTGHKDRPGSGL